MSLVEKARCASACACLSAALLSRSRNAIGNRAGMKCTSGLSLHVIRPGRKWQVSNSGDIAPRWSGSGHDLVYQSGNQLMTVSYSVNSDSFVAEKPRVWIAALSGAESPGGASRADWDLAPDGKRVAALIPEGPPKPRSKSM